MEIDLRPGETILKEGPANLKRGLEVVGGRLWLTSQRLAFKSHAFNIQVGATDIERGDWATTRKVWTKLLAFPWRPIPSR